VTQEAGIKPAESPGSRWRLLQLALLSLIAGAAAGLVTSIFRLALERADRLRDFLLARSHSVPVAGLIAVIAVPAAATAVAAWLVRRFSPHATGSGIPHVEAELNGRWSGNPLHIIPVKFVGGILAIGGGLALGREGPSVQMGASLAHLIGKAGRGSEAQCRALLAAGAGEGLATAFNAPIAGAAFVLEELVRSFNLEITIATLAASASAISVARFFLGQAPDFQVAPLPFPEPGALITYIVLGIVAGVLGVAYNRAILGALHLTDRIGKVPVELRASAIGAAVGLLGYFAPALVGGGDAITQRVLGGGNVVLPLVLAFALRFPLGAVSYAARTPGGLFAPMLVLGSQTGRLLGIPFCRWIPAAGTDPTAYAVVGMAAFFTAVVRAPLTGIILAIELTGSFTMLLPMLGACFSAMLVATLLREPPIYDSLRWEPRD
jgi:CIC family chloride channel protein